ncbi:OPT-domain-containing protein [Russula earlei]|uniref:OPT-domain-containing protein n=1 Tax=Russula earlei TaxID=71964 RepID=A0ACC0UIS3_9AGAM|nr:OPT-domain-containing protein [Russula earlei]
MAARPATRPTTSRGNLEPVSDAHPDLDTQYTYSQEISFDEEDESDDEDVFAFLPPSAAGQPSSPSPAQLPFHSHVPPPYPQPPPHAAAPLHQYPQDLTANVVSPTSPPPPFSSFADPLVYPPPAFIPDASMRYIPEAGPSTTSIHLVGTVDSPSPPSTTEHRDSRSFSIEDGFRLRKLGSLPTAISATTGFTTSSSQIPQDVKRRSALLSEKRLPSALSDMSTVDPELDSASIKMRFDFDTLLEEDSPYPEVRASVSNIDDPDMPVLTIRMWLVGLFLSLTGSAMNVFFNFRQPAPIVIPVVLLLIAHPLGKFLSYSLPITVYRLPRVLGGAQFSLNPGPWNIKEHVLVFIMTNVSVGPAYALNAVVVGEFYYKLRLGFWFSVVILLATQLTGFGLAGLCRRFLVWPASMVWPQNLVTCTLLNTLHAEEDENAGISRFRYFMYVFIGAFFFFFLPGYLFQALSMFSWICWLAPNNVPLNQVFGVASGLGMSVLTFDWTAVSWIGSPFMIPWWAEVHIFAGFVIFYWILTPILYYTNTWYLAHFPMFGTQPYDRFGHPYKVSQVLTVQDTFNMTAYEEYSPLYLPAAFAMTYLLAFALSTCIIVHTLLYHGRTLLNGFKRMRLEDDDIHLKLMQNYPEVPDWWYGTVFVFFFCLAVVAAEVWNTGMPVWALGLSVLLPIVYVLPSGFIYAMTGQAITLNLLAEIIPGTLLPGQPLANMFFKVYSVQTLTESTSFVQDLKLGHYIKVPPRATFIVQLVATLLSAFLQCGIKEWIFASVPDICTPDQPSYLTCPHNRVFFSASAIWGLIGPSRQFGPGSIYHPQLYAIIAGALLPLPFWIMQRRRPDSWAKFVSTPVVLLGVSFIPPATGINYSSWFAVGFVFQFIIRKRNFAWWSKYNYITGAALDCGTVLSLLTIFFTLQLPKGGFTVNWWGNSVFQNTADWAGTPLISTPPDHPLPI